MGEHQGLENTSSLHTLQSKHLLLVRYVTAEVSDLKFREMFEQNSDVDKTAAVGSSAEITLVVALLRKHHTTNSEKIHAEISEKFFSGKRYKTAAGQAGERSPSCETSQLAGGESPSPAAGRSARMKRASPEGTIPSGVGRCQRSRQREGRKPVAK